MKSEIFFINYVLCFLIGIFFGICIGKARAYIITSSKEIKPDVKIECEEFNGVKKCDTTYIYKVTE